MKICYFGDAASIHLKRWVDHFSNRENEVHIISVRDGSVEGAKVYDIGFVELTQKPKKVFVKLLGTLRMIFKIRWLLHRIRPDLVHIHFLYNHPVVFAFKGVRNLIISTWGADIVVDNPPETIRRRLYKTFLLKQARAVTASSHFLAEATAGYTDPGKKIEIIPFGVDPGMFTQSKKSQGDGVGLSFIKRLEPKYGPEFLIRALPMIVQKHPKVRVLIVGGGSLEPDLRQLASRLGVSDKVDFVGPVPHSEVPHYLRLTDILVMPSIYHSETLGVVAIEAMAMGIPVVASRVGGVPEVVGDGTTGFLVPPGAPQEISKAVLNLIEDPALRKQMGENGARRAAEGFDWHRNASDMAKIYRRITKGARVDPG